MLLTIAVLLLAGFFLYQTIDERDKLLTMMGAQEQPVQQARQIKQQLDALASATAKLADEGDVGAKQIIENMKSQGINVNR